MGLKNWWWKLTGKCKHCGNNLQPWNDANLTALRNNLPIRYGKICKKCGMITDMEKKCCKINKSN